MAFPLKLYRKLSKLDFVTGVGLESGQVVVYVGRELRDEEKKQVEAVTTRKVKFEVAGPITGA